MTLVVGGGTNGLSAAAYLGKQGYSTIVLERQQYLGGGVVTKEITLPGYKHDIFATSIEICKASSIQQDLELDKYGYREISPDPVASTPFKNGRAVTIHRDLNAALKSLEQFSKKDAEKFREIFQFYMESKDIILGSLASAPMPFSTMMSALEGFDSGLDFLQFSYKSSRDWLEENFESEEVKAFLALGGSNHVPLSPEDAGGAILVLVFIGLLQDRGAGIPIGRMSTLVNALSGYIDAHGGSTITNEEATEILVYHDHATAVRTRSGKIFEANKGVVASIEP